MLVMIIVGVNTKRARDFKSSVSFHPDRGTFWRY